jgi:predicted alpha-1,6-mannanase (GH76 family)
MVQNLRSGDLIRKIVTIGFCVATLMAAGTRTPLADAQTSASVDDSRSSYSKEISDGVRTLQGWYVDSTGLYQKPTDWWNSANAITVLVDYSQLTHSTEYLGAVENTFHKASKAYGAKNFVNDSNDDEGWWAVAWVDAYDLTKRPAYLAMAQTIFMDMTTQWDTTTCGGGVWWSKDLKNSAYKNAIVNELFLEIAASLANRVSDTRQKARYLDWAQKEWRWFSASGMINSNGLVNDGLNASDPKACTSNNQTTWTYNQGVILGGLAELYTAAPDPALLAKAHAIAHAAITRLVTSDGILQEPPAKGPDFPQFKGIFVRNLARLDRVGADSRYRAFVRKNADSILSKDQGSNHQFGALWQGPFDSADGTRQTSALDALIAAMEMR